MSNRRFGSLIIVGTAIFVSRFFSGQHDVSSQRYLSRVAADANENLPLMVDEFTEWYSTGGEEALISINYRIVNIAPEELASNDLDDAWAEIKANVISGSCALEDFRYLLDEGVTLRMNYADSNYNHLQSFDVVNSDCS